MIEVVYDRKALSLSVKGHAQSGEPGHDLVCAAASILVYTLASNVLNIADDKKHIRRPNINIEEGDASISCTPIHGMQAVTTLIFDSICSGFDILAQRCPDNIQYTIVEG